MKRSCSLFGLVAALALLPQAAGATTMTFEYTVQFSNGTFPGGAAPWLRATFDDTAAAPGSDVRITVEVLNLAATEFVSNWWFNLNPALGNVATNVGFTFIDTSDVSSMTITWGNDCCNADGGGRYDVRFAFPTAAGIGRLTNGESIVIDANWFGGTMLATDFNFIATPQGGNGPFLSAAHIQGIVGGDGSTFVAPGEATFPVPEPGTLALLGGGLTLVARRLRRRQ